ncbi:hypothetical protein PRIC2_000695 [Phytophthora ramorum]
MSDAQSRKDASSPAQERPAESTTTAEASAPQKHEQNGQSHLSDDEYVMVDAIHQAKEKEGRSAETPKENGHKQMQNGGLQGVEVANGAVEKEVGEEKHGVQEQTPQPSSEEVHTSGERVMMVEQKLEVNTEDVVGESSKGEEKARASAHVPSPAIHISGVDMVFPEDEVPIELCPFSSDGSVNDLPLRRSNDTEDTPPEAGTAPPSTVITVLPATPTAESAASAETAPITPASVTAEESVTPSEVGRTMGRRKRRKKLGYSASRRREVAKAGKEQNSVPASPALEDKLSIAVNGHAAQNGGDIEADRNAPPSPVYPDADASHLYPSTPEGAPWQWEDIDPYFDPLAQSDLDNLVRWRNENANFIAANPTVWRGKSGVETKRAVLEAMVADASDMTTDHVEYPIRRGRSYRDVWEEKDFLAQQKRDSSAGESHLKSQAMKIIKKRKGAVDAKGSLLASHRDLVYGYDDDLFQDFRRRLEDRVKACQSKSPPTTPRTPPPRRQQATTTKVDEGTMDITAQEVVFEEELLPSFPINQLHPASLGLWKLRKNQEPDFDVVHPASVNRVEAPARWKEEMTRHHQQQYELQLQQTDELADPSDGDDEGTGDNTHPRLHATISNSEIAGGLPSFGDCTEEDEVSQVLAASVSKLIPLSMLNWRTTQLVYERAACSIQCAPILEGEAAAARELEDVYLQLCPPGDASEEPAAPPGTAPARRPRTTQINSVPHDMIAYSVRRDIADNCSLAVAASVEFALGLHVGDVVDVLDRNGCWNYGEVVETYSEIASGIAKFVLLRFSLWPEDTVEWIAVSEGRLLPHGVADGSRPCSVGPTRAHRVRVRYDQSLARELERSFPQRQAKQATAASHMLAHRQQTTVNRSSSEQQKTPQKRKRKRPAKSTAAPSSI